MRCLLVAFVLLVLSSIVVPPVPVGCPIDPLASLAQGPDLDPNGLRRA